MTQYQSIVEQIETYKHPTRTGKAAIPAMFVLGGGFGTGVGFLGVLVFGWLGLYVQVIAPVIIGFAAGVGIGLGLLYFGPVGYRWFFSIAAIASGLVGYFAMLFFIGRTIDPVDPLGLMRSMITVPERTFIGLTVPLWLWWTIEGLIAVGVARLIAWFFEPATLCGECGKDCNELLEFSIANEHTRDALHALADKDYERLKALQSAVGMSTRLQANLCQCLHTTHDAYLSLTTITRDTVAERARGTGPVERGLVRLAVVSGAGAALLRRDFPPNAGTAPTGGDVEDAPSGSVAAAAGGGRDSASSDRDGVPGDLPLEPSRAQPARLEAAAYRLSASTDEDSVPEVLPLEPPQPQPARLEVAVYQAVDQTTPGRVLLMLLWSTVLGCVAAVLLHLFSMWIGVHIFLLLALLLGVAIFFGAVIGEGDRRVERRWVFWFVSIVAGGISYAVLVLLKGPGIDLASPLQNLEYFASAAGTWERTFFVVSLPLWSKWAVESAILILGMGYICADSLGNPYCYDCHELCKRRTLFTTINQLAGNLINAMADGDYHEVRRVAAADPDDRNELSVEIYYCKDLDHAGYFTLTSVARKEGSKGTKPVELVRFGVIKREGSRALVEAFPQEK